jgi:hypothetical protein
MTPDGHSPMDGPGTSRSPTGMRSWLSCGRAAAIARASRALLITDAWLGHRRAGVPTRAGHPRARVGEDHPNVASLYHDISELEHARGDIAAAERYALRAVEVCGATARPGRLSRLGDSSDERHLCRSWRRQRGVRGRNVRRGLALPRTLTLAESLETGTVDEMGRSERAGGFPPGMKR